MFLLLYIYITIFTIYFILLSIVSNKKSRKIRDKYTSKDSNICVVLYATGKCSTLEPLIKQLKEQHYPQNNYTIYTILDKCEDISEVTLQTEQRVNVMSVNNMEPIGKSQAYSIIADKLQNVNDLDAYVFLDARQYVDSDFLSNVNYYLTKYEIFNPIVTYLPQDENTTLLENIKSVYSRYCSNFLTLSRSKLGLTNILNTDAFAIKRDLLNRMASFDFKDLTSEVEYTLKLAKENIKVGLIEELRTYKSISSYDIRIPSLSKRISLFFAEILHPQTLCAREFVCSFVAPNWLTCILIYLVLLCHGVNFPFFVNNYNLLITFAILGIAFCVSLLNTKLNLKESMYLLLYPFYSICRMIYNFPLIRGIRRQINSANQKHVIETMTTDVIVTDGTRNFQCQLELISDNGLAKVTFINNGKKYTTKNNHLRMIDAIKELITKLSDYGLSMKICQCCKYFQPVADGTTNMVKGCCNCQFQGRNPGDCIPTLLWNNCPNFEEDNVVNLF